MQKFTVFSIILSLSIILIIGDLVFHDYLKKDSDETVSIPEMNLPSEESTVEESAVEGNSVQLPESNEDVIPSSEEELVVLKSALNATLFDSVGFQGSVLKEALYSGMIFQFIPFSDQTDALIYQWNFFEGSTFVGSIYEVKYSSETGSFQGYMALRDRASTLSNLGILNETNTYGDASFYFNHLSKTKTVHMVMRSGANVYAFEYAYAKHDIMKKMFELL